MKFTNEDFLDRLAGGPDKHDFVKKIKESCLHEGLKVKITRRDSANGKKIYFHVSRMHDDECYDSSPFWYYSEEIIKKYFPDAYLTSGCKRDWTFAEFR